MIRSAAFFLLCALGVAQQAPETHFHHLHLNATDPAGAISFYTSKFDCEKAQFAGADAVWAQKSWLLFNKVSSAPPWEITSGVWHFGWGAEDMKATYQKQLDSGTRFFTPITELFPGFFYAYVESPDRALIELNTAQHHHFGHLHLLSADPVGTGEWYIKWFGATRRGTAPVSREPRFRNGFQIGPSMSLMMDNVNIIVYPIEYSRKQYADHWKPGQTGIAPTEGRVVDHVAFSFENLPDAVERMRRDGVTVTGEIAVRQGVRSAFVDGPDRVRIELVEGHARR